MPALLLNYFGQGAIVIREPEAAANPFFFSRRRPCWFRSSYWRFVRYCCHDTEVCVVDPEGSVFADFYETGDPGLHSSGSHIEGIGRPRVEPSFVSTVVDRMIRVPDAASFAAMRVLSNVLARRVGGSTGTGFYGALELVAEMREAGEHGSLVSLICDSGDRYSGTYYDDAWLAAHGYDIEPYVAEIRSLLSSA